MSLLLLLNSSGGGAAPTYATWNPADKGSAIVLSDGDLAVTNSTGGTWNSARGTIGKSTGKWQFEVEIGLYSGATVSIIIGVGKAAATVDSYLGSDSDGWGYFGANGNKMNGGSGTAFAASFGASDIITVYYDADTGTLGFKNNATDLGTIATGLTGEVFPMISVYSSSLEATLNCGQTALTHPKAGYNERWADA